MLSYYFTYTSALPVLAAVCVLAYVPYGVYVTKCNGQRPGLYHLAKCLLGLCVASLLYLTVFFFYPNISFHPEAYHLNLVPFIWVTECYTAGPRIMAAQLLLNIAMFLPLGLLLPIAAHRLRSLPATALTVLLATGSIETFQYFIGRSADVDDVIMNFLGGLLGYLCFRLLDRSLGTTCWWQEALGLSDGRERVLYRQTFAA